MLEKTPELKAHVDHILDVFGGGDGGIGFYAFALIAEEMGARKDDVAAAKIVQIITDFANLLRSCDSYVKGARNG